MVFMRNFERDSENHILCDDNPGVWLADAMQRPSDFGYFGDNENMFVTWSLGPVIETRDSDIQEKSNAEALRRFLASDPSLEGEYRFGRCGHWACGWVEHLSFHAYTSDDDKTKEPTRIARILAAWFQYLADDYPLADEDLHSEMVSEADYEWITDEGPRAAERLGFELPEDDWYDQVTSWWDGHRSSALEDTDGNGASPSDEDWQAAFEALEYKRTTDEEDSQ
jgi:hypothetical protein